MPYSVSLRRGPLPNSGVCLIMYANTDLLHELFAFDGLAVHEELDVCLKHRWLIRRLLVEKVEDRQRSAIDTGYDPRTDYGPGTDHDPPSPVSPGAA